MMGEFASSTCLLLLLLFTLVSSGLQAEYDSTAYSECYSEPKDPLYKGGTLINPSFGNGSLEGWSALGNSKLEVRSTADNYFLVATFDNDPPIEGHGVITGPSQALHNVTIGTKYAISAWVQVNNGSLLPNSSLLVYAKVAIGRNKSICVGNVLARPGCWSFLKGGFALNSSILELSTTLYFEGGQNQEYNHPKRLGDCKRLLLYAIAIDGNYALYYHNASLPGVEVWLDSVSSQPFTEDEWIAQQDSRIEKARMRQVRIHIEDSSGEGASEAKVELLQTRLGFGFGLGIAKSILNNTAYQKWFLERFNVAVFRNELKWYYTEPTRGNINYTIADQMLDFFMVRGIPVRGHNVLWADPHYTPFWANNIQDPDEFMSACFSRVDSVVRRYKGQLFQWDVINEMLHFSYLEERLGPHGQSLVYSKTQELDPDSVLFVNDYNTLEMCDDVASVPDAYVARMTQLKEDGIRKLGIGLESRFGEDEPNLVYMRATLDKLGTLGVPIWLTEVHVNRTQIDLITVSKHLKQILREGFSHPYVEGMLMWIGINEADNCGEVCLTDANMNNLPIGDVVDNLLKEWGSNSTTIHKTNYEGYIEIKKYVGNYKLNITYNNTSFTRDIQIVSGDGVQQLSIQI